MAQGANVTVGTSAAVLTATSKVVQRGWSVKAHGGNSGTVYVGLAGTITAGSDTSSGWPLAAGEEVFLPAALFVDAGLACDISLVYAIASATSQKVSWLGC
jgi:hypothetical protein